MDKPKYFLIFCLLIFSLQLLGFFSEKDIAKEGIGLKQEAQSAVPAETFIFPPCDNGLITNTFQANRTTFGFSDLDFILPFNPNLANKKVAIGCDSVQIRVAGTVGSNPLTDSLGIVLEYDNPNGSNDASETFLFASANVRFTVGGTDFECPLADNSLTINNLGTKKILRFDLGNCLTGLGLTLAIGDSVEFLANFSVNPDGPYGQTFSVVPNFKAFTFATFDGSTIACDPLSETFHLAKNEVVFDFPNSNLEYPSGCSQGELFYRLFIPDNEFSDFFGNELRPATKVDSVVINFPTDLLESFSGGEVEVSIPGHPVFGNAYFPVRPLSDFPDGHYVARFDTLSRIPTYNLVANYTFDLRIKLLPTCASSTGGIIGTNLYAFSAQIHYADRLYAGFIGDGSCVEEKTETGLTAMAYTAPPTLAMTTITPANDTLMGGIGEWVVQVCNTSTQSSAPLTWVAAEQGSGVLDLLSIENITNPGSPVALALVNYGTGKNFAYTPSLPPNSCATLRVRATVSDCNDLDFKLSTGWNCGPFDEPNWSPDLYVPCSETSLPLSLTNPSNSAFNTVFQNIASQCQPNGTESLMVEGMLTAVSNLPNDTYTIQLFWDKNGDDAVQGTDSLLVQTTISGTISPSNPLNFNILGDISPAWACHLLMQVQGSSADACGILEVALALPILQNAGADFSFCDTNSPIMATLGLDCMGGYSVNWSALAPATNAMLDDSSSQTPLLVLPSGAFTGQTLAFVAETVRPGCPGSTSDTVFVEISKLEVGFSAADTVSLQALNCASTADLCANIAAIDFPDFVVSDNGQPFQGSVLPCNGQNIALQLATGFHELIFSDTVSGCADTLWASVSCASTDTVFVEILLNESDTICFDNAQLTGPIASLTNVCPDGSVAIFGTLGDSCVMVEGSAVGGETACIVACDGNGICDTTILIINVLHPIANGIKDTVSVTQVKQFCFNSSMLNLDGQLATIENICPANSGLSVNFSVNPTNFCVNYEGISPGTDSACIRLCDDLGNCDTINICVVTVPGTVVTDTIFITVDTVVYCFDEDLLPGNITVIEDICTSANGEQVVFSVENGCIVYTGIAPGQDTACFRLVDETGNVALVSFEVLVVKTTPQKVTDTIFVGQTVLFCLDTLELPGNILDVEEFCPDSRTGNANFILAPPIVCIEYQGITPGLDSACVIVCDDIGFCDTTYFCLLVKPYFDPPTLGNDTVFTDKNRPVVIDVLKNDTVFGGIENLFILTPPISGEAVLNGDRTFSYIPNDPVCDRWDEFTYVLCNPNGCDTTTVSIFIKCLELTVFSAISPNNDGVNDLFYIAKIKDFPENHLWVYNRWGNLVFETTQYNNTWPGSWGSDVDLPDGSYFYILEWTDAGTTTVQRGWVELFR